MSDGVVLVDADERIVLANDAFCARVGRSEAALLALRLSSLAWRDDDERIAAAVAPWNLAIENGEPVTDARLSVEPEGEADTSLRLRVSASPILGAWQRAKGAIVSFKDVTELERSQGELESALVELEKSRDEVRLHNEELQVLAATDGLTGLTNRRSFIRWFEDRFARTRAVGEPLTVVIVDIDFFKRVNDEHGHSMGDEVICCLARLLKRRTPENAMACRYGGEEFCVAFAGRDASDVAVLCERIRAEVAAEGFAPVPVTASFGVASSESGATLPLQLIDQADQALYKAKERGRNRVIRFDRLR